jgi:multimeric flavodoxin WrbA
MVILGLIGSPRKGGNTDILVDAILAAARSKGHDTSKVYLYDVGIGPCVDCRGCKKDELVCVLKDGMRQLYPMLDAADVIVFGTPVYWCGPSGTMKNLVDRLRPYFSNGRLKGKKAVLAAPAGDGPAEGDLLTEMFRRSLKYLEVEFVGQVLGKAYDIKDILGDEKAMKQAVAMGKSL